MREAAARTLAGSDEGRARLARLAKDDESPRVRSLSLAALQSVGETDAVVAAAASDSSVDVRSAAVRYLGNTAGCSANLKQQPSPEVRAEVMRHCLDPAVKETLWQAVADPDAFVAQAARQGLTELHAVDANIDLDELSAPQRLAALLILREANVPGGTRLLPRLLRDPNVDVRFAAVQWVGEERLTEFREPLVEALSAGPATARLFGGYLSALERLEGVSRIPSNEWSGEQYIVLALEDPATSPEARRWALRMLRPDHPLLTVDRLRQYLTGEDEALQLEAVRSLRDSRLAERDTLLAEVAGSDAYSPRLRAEAIVGLAPNSDSTKKLLVQLAGGNNRSLRNEALRSLRGAELDAGDVGQLKALASNDASLAEMVTRVLEPKNNSLAPSNTNVDAWVSLLDGSGDPEAGERIFFHRQAAACARCHQIEGRGAKVGPELTATARTLDERRLVESIVQPSKEIAPQFVSWLVVTKSGQPLTGVLVHEEATGEQTYADQQGKLTVLTPDEIESRRPQATSLMPDGLPGQMTVQEFRDLLAFLRGPGASTAASATSAPATPAGLGNASNSGN